MDLRELFAFNLRRLRHEKGLSQEVLAHEAGVNRSYLSEIERAVSFVGLEIIGKLADALEAEPIQFFGALPHRPGRKASKPQS